MVHLTRFDQGMCAHPKSNLVKCTSRVCAAYVVENLGLHSLENGLFGGFIFDLTLSAKI